MVQVEPGQGEPMEWTPLRAREVASAWCAATGLCDAVPRLVRFRQNAIFRLSAQALSLRVYGPEDAWFKARLMVAFARFLAERGIPAVRLAAVEARQPTDVLGTPVSVWRWIDEVPSGGAAHRAHGALLRRLHDVADGFCGATRPFDPLGKIRSRIDRLIADGRLADDALRTLEWALARVTEVWEEAPRNSALGDGVVHGDALIGNTVASASGLALIDFDSVVRAPRTWDLAPTLVAARRYPSADFDAWHRFLDGYGAAADTLDDVEPMALVKELSITVALCLSATRSSAIDREIAQRVSGWAKWDHGVRWRHP